ncbi:hypothetical protein ACXR2U_16555 [Jatrophihabitans sp. YIM 134969]
MSSRRSFLLAGSLGAAGAAGAAVLGPAAAAEAAPASAPRAVFHDSYAGKSGRLPRADSGQRYRYTGALDLVAQDGALQLSSPSLTRPLPGAAYQQACLGAPISYIGAWFRLDATGGRTTNGSGILLGAFSDFLYDASTSTAGIHVVLGLDYWAYFVIDAGTPVALMNGPYAPLPTDTPLFAEVTIDGTTATLVTPDGATHSVTDARLGTLGRSWLTTEITRNDTRDVLGTYTALQAATS